MMAAPTTQWIKVPPSHNIRRNLCDLGREKEGTSRLQSCYFLIVPSGGPKISDGT